jgi:hypothetical protein
MSVVSVKVPIMQASANIETESMQLNPSSAKTKGNNPISPNHSLSNMCKNQLPTPIEIQPLISLLQGYNDMNYINKRAMMALRSLTCI